MDQHVLTQHGPPRSREERQSETQASRESRRTREERNGGRRVRRRHRRGAGALRTPSAKGGPQRPVRWVPGAGNAGREAPQPALAPAAQDRATSPAPGSSSQGARTRGPCQWGCPWPWCVRLSRQRQSQAQRVGPGCGEGRRAVLGQQRLPAAQPGLWPAWAGCKRRLVWSMTEAPARGFQQGAPPDPAQGPRHASDTPGWAPRGPWAVGLAEHSQAAASLGTDLTLGADPDSGLTARWHQCKWPLAPRGQQAPGPHFTDGNRGPEASPISMWGRSQPSAHSHWRLGGPPQSSPFALFL